MFGHEEKSRLAIIKHSKWIIILIAACGFLVFGLRLRKESPREKLLHKIFASHAEALRRGAFPSYSTTSEAMERRKQAIALLSNRTLDNKVLLVGAQVRPPTIHEHEHPLFRDSPYLTWFVVDELANVGLVYYADSNDPNSFGKPFFSVGHYCRLSACSEEDMLPKHIWLLRLKCYGQTEPYYSASRLYKYDDGYTEPYMLLEMSISEWNALLCNRGQLILRDKDFYELDRVRLTPLSDPQERKIMESLMLPAPIDVNEPNGVWYNERP